jgi:hypothetical protein
VALTCVNEATSSRCQNSSRDRVQGASRSLFLRIHVVGVPEMWETEQVPDQLGEVEIQMPFEPVQAAIYLWRSIWSSGPKYRGPRKLQIPEDYIFPWVELYEWRSGERAHSLAAEKRRR